MNSAKPLSRILKSVSRSFFLSIQFLPPQIQRTIAVGYLLARASDTIADSNPSGGATNVEYLKTFEEVLHEKQPLSALDSIIHEVHPEHSGEKALISALPDCIAAFHRLRVWDQEQVLEVMGHILKGQANDVMFFGNDPKKMRGLPDARALDEYTFQVAGSVGEFWTRVGGHHIKPYSNLAEPVLLEFGRHFGQALQLVNILRDVRVDLMNGRCYLPENELREAGLSVAEFQSDPARGQAVLDRWMEKAEFLLNDAREYIQAVRPARIRFACAVPYLLARATLKLLRERSPLSVSEKMKVPRSAVRSAIVRSVFIAFTNLALPRTN